MLTQYATCFVSHIKSLPQSVIPTQFRCNPEIPWQLLYGRAGVYRTSEGTSARLSTNCARIALELKSVCGRGRTDGRKTKEMGLQYPGNPWQSYDPLPSNRGSAINAIKVSQQCWRSVSAILTPDATIVTPKLSKFSILPPSHRTNHNKILTQSNQSLCNPKSPHNPVAITQRTCRSK